MWNPPMARGCQVPPGATGFHRARGGQTLALTVAPIPAIWRPSIPWWRDGPGQAAAAGDAGHERVLAVLLHGDAAFAGQGVVAETLNMSQLHGYRTGGTVHVVVNNQIGFTANPVDTRSSPYCTDTAKGIQAPVFHVNGDDPDAIAQVVDLAMDYRQQFHRDVVLDMVCYRGTDTTRVTSPATPSPCCTRRSRNMPPWPGSTATSWSAMGLPSG